MAGQKIVRGPVLAKTGILKGKAFQLPWNHKEAQKLFSGERFAI